MSHPRLRRSRRPLLAFLLLAGLLPFRSAIAVQARARTLPVEEMTQKAAVVGVATVQSSSVRRDPANGMIFTDHILKFTEVWKGGVQDPFTLVQAGGQIGNQVAEIAGEQYLLKKGESIVVFASPRPPAQYNVIGIRQGLYRVGSGADPKVVRESETPAVGPPRPAVSLRSLKAQVYQSLGRPVETVPDSPARPEPGPAGPVSSATSTPSEGPTSPLSRSTAPPEDPPSHWMAWIVVGGVFVVLAVALRRRIQVRPEP